MEFKAFLHYAPVSMWGLRAIGWLLTGKRVVHSRLYWQDGNDLWNMTELTNKDPYEAAVLGVGGGYTIQAWGVASLPARGTLVGLPRCDRLNILKYAKQYASTENGDLNSRWAAKDLYPEPQGYGGPMYTGENTSNTYVSWLIGKVCAVVPDAPDGAVGWDDRPWFPGPERTLKQQLEAADVQVQRRND